MTAEDVARRSGSAVMTPDDYVNGDPELQRVMSLIAERPFFRAESPAYSIRSSANLMDHDPFCVLPDFRAYAYCQRHVSRAFAQEDTWMRKAILNVASMGTFSSDRSIKEYAENIWHVDARQSEVTDVLLLNASFCPWWRRRWHRGGLVRLAIMGNSRNRRNWLFARTRKTIRAAAGSYGNRRGLRRLFAKLPNLEILANFGVGYEKRRPCGGGCAQASSLPTRQMC